MRQFAPIVHATAAAPHEPAPGKKTYKLYVGGAFPLGVGAHFEAEGHNVARASRKDARDAVRRPVRRSPPGRA